MKSKKLLAPETFGELKSSPLVTEGLLGYESSYIEETLGVTFARVFTLVADAVYGRRVK